MASEQVSAHDLRKFSGVVGWLAVVFGIVLVGVGIFLIVSPKEAISTITVIVGILLLLDGVIAICSSIFSDGEGRGLLAIVGILSAIAGLILIKKPFETLVVLVLIVGIWLIVVGIARFAGALSERGDRGMNIFISIVDVIAGIVLLSVPHIGVSTFAVIFGIVLVIRGLLFIVGGFAFRSIGHDAADALE